MGERPAVLSRGYARADRADGVVVVRDPEGMRADLDRSGDEPLMLAHRLDGVAVLVSSSRYLAGRLAEHHFGSTVHVLDDGFQHFDLFRDADLVSIARDDLEGAKTLPTGRLREPLDAARDADAFITLGGVSLDAIAAGKPAWHGSAVQSPPTTTEPVLAVAGIARPERFFDALQVNRWSIAATLPFRDHHRYSAGDVAGIVASAKAAQARRVVTTEKDYVRLLPFRPFAMPIEPVPLSIVLDDEAAFDRWLSGVLGGAQG
jgi:tetraacyldisaccharide 4'-kinase